jgi:CubicO group peptidase (beta-lactamase class C family)
MRALALAMTLLLAACATVPREPPVHAEVGVAFDRTGEIASFADGIADAQSGRRVTADDPVRVASVSKMVVGIGVMKLVEQGRLDLAGDVSRWLGWPLRNP